MRFQVAANALFAASMRTNSPFAARGASCSRRRRRLGRRGTASGVQAVEPQSSSVTAGPSVSNRRGRVWATRTPKLSDPRPPAQGRVPVGEQEVVLVGVDLPREPDVGEVGVCLCDVRPGRVVQARVPEHRRETAVGVEVSCPGLRHRADAVRHLLEKDLTRQRAPSLRSRREFGDQTGHGRPPPSGGAPRDAAHGVTRSSRGGVDDRGSEERARTRGGIAAREHAPRPLHLEEMADDVRYDRGGRARDPPGRESVIPYRCSGLAAATDTVPTYIARAAPASPTSGSVGIDS